ncbi:MAG: hypothetical protein HY335_06730 [Deinococcus sp.]|nr:hypothetical protein [Deinococcus sp.]
MLQQKIKGEKADFAGGARALAQGIKRLFGKKEPELPRVHEGEVRLGPRLADAPALRSRIR